MLFSINRIGPLQKLLFAEPLIPLIVVQDISLNVTGLLFSKENRPVLVTELTGQTLKQCIQTLTMCFQRKPSLSLQ